MSEARRAVRPPTVLAASGHVYR